MATKPRPEFDLPPLQCDRDVVVAIKAIGDLSNRHDARAAQAKADTQAVALRAAGELLGLQAEMDARMTNLRSYCETHRKRLTGDGATKTVRFATGEVSWRNSPAAVKFARGIKAADIIERIKAAGKACAKFIHNKETVNKNAMRDDPDLALTIEGVRIRSAGEEFYIVGLEPELSDEVES